MRSRNDDQEQPATPRLSLSERRRLRLQKIERDPDVILSGDVIDLLERIEGHRREIAAEQELLRRWLAWSPDLQEAWNKFQRYGGTSGQDFRALMQGNLRHRLNLRSKKHLRLISNRQPRPIRLRRDGR